MAERSSSDRVGHGPPLENARTGGSLTETGQHHRVSRTARPLDARPAQASGDPPGAHLGNLAGVFVNGRSVVDRLTGPRHLGAKRTPPTDGRCPPPWPAANARR